MDRSRLLAGVSGVFRTGMSGCWGWGQRCRREVKGDIFLYRSCHRQLGCCAIVLGDAEGRRGVAGWAVALGPRAGWQAPTCVVLGPALGLDVFLSSGNRITES